MNAGPHSDSGEAQVARPVSDQRPRHASQPPWRGSHIRELDEAAAALEVAERRVAEEESARIAAEARLAALAGILRTAQVGRMIVDREVATLSAERDRICLDLIAAQATVQAFEVQAEQERARAAGAQEAAEQERARALAAEEAAEQERHRVAAAEARAAAGAAELAERDAKIERLVSALADAHKQRDGAMQARDEALRDVARAELVRDEALAEAERAREVVTAREAELAEVQGRLSEQSQRAERDAAERAALRQDWDRERDESQRALREERAANAVLQRRVDILERPGPRGSEMEALESERDIALAVADEERRCRAAAEANADRLEEANERLRTEVADLRARIDELLAELGRPPAEYPDDQASAAEEDVHSPAADSDEMDEADDEEDLDGDEGSIDDASEGVSHSGADDEDEAPGDEHDYEPGDDDGTWRSGTTSSPRDLTDEFIAEFAVRLNTGDVDWDGYIPEGYQHPVCRHAQRALLDALDQAADGLPVDQVARLAQDATCGAAHHHTRGILAHLMNQHLIHEVDTGVALTRPGRDWLDLHGLLPSEWSAYLPAGKPKMRAWQEEALDVWVDHGRHGVVSAVTGTGKSLVGIEAAREAIRDGYRVLVLVPTRDLVTQWEKAMRQHDLPRPIGICTSGKSRRDTLATHKIVIATPGCAVKHLLPGLDDLRARGEKFMIVADECHRYGAKTHVAALSEHFDRRLGLTATFHRSDERITELLDFFGGAPVFNIGFDRAIRDGIIAPFTATFIGVSLSDSEQADYDTATNEISSAMAALKQAKVIRDGMSTAQIFQALAAISTDPTAQARLRKTVGICLSAMARRRKIVSGSTTKFDTIPRITEFVEPATGAIVFHERADDCYEVAKRFQGHGIKAAAISSRDSDRKRQDALTALRAKAIKVLVAPRILDEGIDVPDVDLGIVMGATKQRRQMTQRMGRVLRTKADGRAAHFVFVYSRGTYEDPDCGSMKNAAAVIEAAASSVDRLAVDTLSSLPEAS